MFDVRVYQDKRPVISGPQVATAKVAASPAFPKSAPGHAVRQGSFFRPNVAGSEREEHRPGKERDCQGSSEGDGTDRRSANERRMRFAKAVRNATQKERTLRR